MRLCALFFFFLSSLLAAEETFPSFDPHSIKTVEGQVVSVQKYHIVIRPVPYVQFILSAQGEDYTVEVGPEWYINERGLVLVPRENLEVTGSCVPVQNKKIIFATGIKKGEQQFSLRQEDGSPLWNTRR